MRRSIRFTARMFGLNSLASADFYAAARYYEKGDNILAIWGWKELAAEGDRDAKFILGVLNEDPSMVALGGQAQNAIDWIWKGAEQDNGYLQNLLGRTYEYGYGVAPDIHEAIKWYRDASNQDLEFYVAGRTGIGRVAAEGHLARIEEHLADLFMDGQKVPQHYEQAQSWYRRAAENGSLNAHYMLSVMHCGGLGLPQSDKDGALWFHRAAERQVDHDRLHYGSTNHHYFEASGVPGNDREAVEIYRKDAENGMPVAKRLLALRYETGAGVGQNYAEAARLSEEVAKIFFGDAAIRLAFLFSLGKGVPQDYVQAHRWFNLAARDAGSVPGNAAAIARDCIARRMTTEQVNEAQRLAWKTAWD